MSATSRGTDRDPNDNYPTQPKLVRGLFRSHGGLRTMGPSTVLDPCAGEGQILSVVKEFGHTPVGIEIRDECEEALGKVCEDGFHLIGDGLADPPDPSLIVITNPPFSLAEEFIRHYAGRVAIAAFLLRLNFLGGQKRRAGLWKTHRPAWIGVLPERPAFVAVCKGSPAKTDSTRVKGCGALYPLGTKGGCACGGRIGDGTDATEYAWFVFVYNNLATEPRLGWIEALEDE